MYDGITSDLENAVETISRLASSSTLSAILGQPADGERGWTTRRTATRVVLSAEHEVALKAWMDLHLTVGEFVEHPEPEAVESDVIALMQPPLNLAKNTQHPLRPVMISARAAWHRSAD